MTLKNDCRHIEDLLPVYNEGETGPEEQQRVEAHLFACPSCARLLALLRATEKALAGFPEVEPSDELLARLSAIPGAAPEAKRGFVVRLVRQPVFAVAASLLLFVSLFLANPNRDDIVRFFDRQAHVGYSKAERLYVKAGAWIGSLGAHKDDALASLKRLNLLGDKNKN